MCLSKPRQIKTDKDIVCYKVLMVYKDEGPLYVSDVQCFPYHLESIYSTNKKKPKTTISAHHSGEVIEGDAFHSFKTLRGARSYIKAYKGPVSIHEYVIVKCIIPKESEYIYEGEYECFWYNTYKAYASQMIKPIEVIK